MVGVKKQGCIVSMFGYTPAEDYVTTLMIQLAVSGLKRFIKDYLLDESKKKRYYISSELSCRMNHRDYSQPSSHLCLLICSRLHRLPTYTPVGGRHHFLRLFVTRLNSDLQ